MTCEGCGTDMIVVSVVVKAGIYELTNSYGGLVGRASGDVAWCVACEQPPFAGSRGAPR